MRLLRAVCLGLATGLLGLMLLGSGCAGELPEAAGKEDAYFPPTPDVSPWPDGSQGQGDLWWGSSDGYSGSPFGCQRDSDCFGQRCCQTPWGVKLCAATCPQR